MIYASKIKDPDLQKRVMAFAKQVSNARLIFRQCNHPSMVVASQDVIDGYPKPKDNFDYAMNSTVTVCYTVYGYAELIAWLADAKLLQADAAKWFRYGLYLWLVALFCGILKTIRNIIQKPWEKTKGERITLTGFLCDFVSGVNSLPAGFLWAGKLTTRQAASFSFIASAIGFWKLY